MLSINLYAVEKIADNRPIQKNVSCSNSTPHYWYDLQLPKLPETQAPTAFPSAQIKNH